MGRILFWWSHANFVSLEELRSKTISLKRMKQSWINVNIVQTLQSIVRRGHVVSSLLLNLLRHARNHGQCGLYVAGTIVGHESDAFRFLIATIIDEVSFEQKRASTFDDVGTSVGAPFRLRRRN